MASFSSTTLAGCVEDLACAGLARHLQVAQARTASPPARRARIRLRPDPHRRSGGQTLGDAAHSPVDYGSGL